MTVPRSLPGPIGPAVLALAAAVLLAGCVGLGGDEAGEAVSQAVPDPVPLPGDGNGSDGDARGSAGASYPACEHPWPCGDGSEWPKHLVADEHPRQPPVFPDDLGIQDGRVLERGDTAVAYRFTGGAGTGFGDAEPTYDEATTAFEVPAGLHLDLTARIRASGEDPAPPEGDFAYNVRIRDGGGAALCRGYHAFSLGSSGYESNRTSPCRVPHIDPLPRQRNWTVEVETRHNVEAADSFRVTVDLERIEPETRFPIDSIDRVNVTSFDGTTLHGWIMRPDLPDGVEAPVLLGSTPYAGQVSERPGDPGFGSYAEAVYGLDLPEMVERGYAVAIFNVRGTGYSGGCHDVFGPKEQRDQAVLVDWLGNRSWSNDRVGMIGRSYRAGTAWEAAIQNPEPLKTTVTAGVVTNWYTLIHTPQGASFGPALDAYLLGLLGSTTGPPPEGEPGNATRWAPLAPERACPTTADWTTAPTADKVRDDRDRSFWEPRRLIDDVGNVTAATLLTHGLHDGQVYQDSKVWETLPPDTPKHMIQGSWAHEFPNQNSIHEGQTMAGWDSRAVDWLDFWLKGLGEPPDVLGTVDYQDHAGQWYDAQAWPPAAREEVLHLAPGTLSGAPSDDARSFRSAPDVASSVAADETLGQSSIGENPGPVCRVHPDEGGPDTFVSYVSDPVPDPATVAGNPLAYLNITASRPGGLVHVTVLDLGPDFRCDDQGVPHDATLLTHGTADLRFHDGGYTGDDFPTGTATRVRVDLADNVVTVEPGHRVGVWVSHGDPNHRIGQPFTPEVTVHGDSEVVLPGVEGTLGGHAPTHDYPPRPFVPHEGEG